MRRRDLGFATAFLLLACRPAASPTALSGESTSIVDSKLGNETSMTQKIAVVPGRSIGGIELGTARDRLPAGAVITTDIGSVGAIGFSLAGQTVDDVWVDDLEANPVSFEIDGQIVSSTSGLADWERLLGDCMRVDGVIGGTFYNCRRGLTLGFDIAGALSQIRLKPR
jgi:hypothetical protein